ncbi:MAG: SusC/RagA family TonB-linked outer membrane protein, partial [Chryseolinea sp.]
MRKFYSSLLALIITLSALAQTDKVTVNGKVTDQADGSALPGLSIIEKGTTNGATTDISGKYTLSVSPNAILVFSFIGYKTQEVEVGNRTTIDISMGSDVVQLQDVVVVGYGTQQKKDITGAVGSVRNNEFKDQPTTNVAGNLQGKMAGVNITSASGTPGAGMLVSIRGASNPLYVVDGVPMLSESNSSLATSFDTEGNVVGSGQNVSSIADINPNDIESVDVMKDASATAIYGARAANGVVFITTKRGKTGKTKINFNYYAGVQKVARKIDFLNSDEFVALNEEARANDLALYNNDNTVFGPGFDPSVLTDPLNYSAGPGAVNTNWLNAVTQTGPIQNYELSASGGDAKTKFYVGGSYFDQEGVVINSAFKRLTLRTNLDHQATEKLSFGLSASVSHSNNRRSFNDNTYTGIITNAIGASPLMPVYDEFGDYSNYEDYQVSWLSDNPVLSANEIIAYTNTNRLIGSVFAEYKFTPALKFRTSWSTDYSYVSDDQFFSPITADAEAVSGRAFKGNFEQLTWLNENILTFSKTFSEAHNVNVVAGFTMQESKSDYTSITGQGFPIGSGLQKISSAAIITNGTNSSTSYGLVSYLARVNYDYKGKYFASATVRADGSSRFPTNKRYGVFPSFSAGWAISEEDFFGEGKTLNYLKLRGSYGITGDQEIGNFQNVSYYQPAKYNGTSGLKPRNIADPNLSWQSNEQLNVGLDWELFNGRVSGSIDYFKSNKTKLLNNSNIAGTTGYSTITTNAGEIQNRGWEFTIGGTPIVNENFKWNSNFNISFIKNEIISWPNDG